MNEIQSCRIPRERTLAQNNSSESAIQVISYPPIMVCKCNWHLIINNSKGSRQQGHMIFIHSQEIIFREKTMQSLSVVLKPNIKITRNKIIWQLDISMIASPYLNDTLPTKWKHWTITGGFVNINHCLLEKSLNDHLLINRNLALAKEGVDDQL